MSRPRLTALLLAMATLLVFLPAAWHGFSLFDDTDYVTENPVVQNGFTWAGVQWAFTTWHASNWHPLTWLSHMLDCELFGLNAGAHHFVNIVLHAANAALLFILLRRLTGALWPCAFIAALFAWHPLRVESVAWIAERKDVLSTLFALLTLLAYVKAVTAKKLQPGRSIFREPAYWLAWFYFALGLMAKPMLVTLPFVMLLLDYLPLQRMAQKPIAGFARLLWEKVPFLLLVMGACVITFLAQHRGGMVVPLEEMPVSYRVANVPEAYLRYLGKMIWPTPLVILYPLPKTFSAPAVICSMAALLVITAVVWRRRTAAPYALVGWLWFLGTLVPVIGLVQIGRVAMADRYSYFPFVGIALAVTFAVSEALKRCGVKPLPVAVGAIAVLVACIGTTENQLRFWRDDVALFSHAALVTKENEPAHVSLGLALEAAGRKSDALAEYNLGLQLNPYRAKTYNYAAELLADAGQTNAALEKLQTALRIAPNDEPTHRNLARLLAECGRTNEALAEFQTALEINPRDTTALNYLGILEAARGRFDQAVRCHARAAAIDPASWRTVYLIGWVRLKQHRDAEAIPCFEQALQLEPNNLQLLLFLAQVLATDKTSQARNGQMALDLALKASALVEGNQPAILDAQAMAYGELGRFDEAEKAVKDALISASANRQTNDISAMQQRLQLYQNHQPFRQSFAGDQAADAVSPQP